MEWCECLGVRKWRDALADLREEAGEILHVKSVEEFLDEFSDVAWGFGRLIAGIFNKNYVRMPFDKRHYKKVLERMNEYGCVRSKRHLVDGKCPKA